MIINIKFLVTNIVKKGKKIFSGEYNVENYNVPYVTDRQQARGAVYTEVYHTYTLMDRGLRA